MSPTRATTFLLAACCALAACMLTTSLPEATDGPAGSGGGGGGSGVACAVASECPGEEGPCIRRVCQDGLCGQLLVTEGTPTESQKASDCQQQVCNGLGEPVMIAADADHYDDRLECTVDGCDDGANVHLNASPGSDCSSDGGTVCDADGRCVVCIAEADCLSQPGCGGAVCGCDDGNCVLKTCLNDVQDADETDVDCGGPSCNPCGDGFGCAAASDCQSLVCGEDTLCAAPTCLDGVHNGAESDLDCGGDECLPCRDGATCSIPNDCNSGVCTVGVCAVPNCTDGVYNGEESDVDCGGGDCLGCGSGMKCDRAQDCDDGLQCVDGVCAAPVGDT